MASPLQAAIVAWGDKTFGKEVNSDPEGRLRKLWEEMEELVRAFGDTGNGSVKALEGEVADVYLCLLVLADTLGMDLERIAARKLKELGSRVYEYHPEKGWIKVGG